MSTVRLRVLKRRTSLEASFEEFFKAEFSDKHGRPDVNLSVFDIQVDGLVRTHAEYVVSLLNPPLKTRGGLSLNGCEGDCDATPSTTDAFLFEHTNTRHVEMRFLRESEVRVLAEQLYRERIERERSSSAREVVDYGCGRLRAEDEEWVRACEAKPRWKRELAR